MTKGEMPSVTHGWDPSCPYCVSSSNEDFVDAEERKRQDRKRVEEARKPVPGTNRVLNKIYDDDREEQRRVPAWVNPEIQNDQTQKMLKKLTKRP